MTDQLRVMRHGWNTATGRCNCCQKRAGRVRRRVLDALYLRTGRFACKVF